METQTQTTNHKTPSAIANELKKEADKNKAFSDVCKVFALRERARAQVTVNTLKAVMDAKGYNYSKDDLKDVLSRMSRIGVGKLHKDTQGRVRGLIDIKYTLQTIGLAAVGEELNLSGFQKSKRFSKINAPAKSPNEIREQFAKAAEAQKPVAKLVKPSSDTILVGTINGKAITIPLTDEQFAEFMSKLVSR